MVLQLTDLFHWPSLVPPPSPGRNVLLVGGEASLTGPGGNKDRSRTAGQHYWDIFGVNYKDITQLIIKTYCRVGDQHEGQLSSKLALQI